MSDELRELLITIKNQDIDGFIKNGCFNLSEDTRKKIEKNIYVPKHETVEQWEARTGETYPGDCPVWRDEHRAHRKHSNDFDGIYLWKLYEYNNWYPEISIVANHHGKPGTPNGE